MTYLNGFCLGTSLDLSLSAFHWWRYATLSSISPTWQLCLPQSW